MSANDDQAVMVCGIWSGDPFPARVAGEWNGWVVPSVDRATVERALAGAEGRVEWSGDVVRWVADAGEGDSFEVAPDELGRYTLSMGWCFELADDEPVATPGGGRTAHDIALERVELIESMARAVALLEGWGFDAPADMDPNDAAAVHAAREVLYLAPIRDDESADEGLDAAEVWDSMALEVFAEGRTGGGGEWYATRAVALLTYGGPTVRLVYDGTRAWVEASWAPDTASVEVLDAAALAAVDSWLGLWLEADR